MSVTEDVLRRCKRNKTSQRGGRLYKTYTHDSNANRGELRRTTRFSFVATLEIRKTVYIRTVIFQLDGYLILNRVIDFFCVCFKTSGIKLVIYFKCLI